MRLIRTTFPDGAGADRAMADLLGGLPVMAQVGLDVISLPVYGHIQDSRDYLRLYKLGHNSLLVGDVGSVQGFRFTVSYPHNAYAL